MYCIVGRSMLSEKLYGLSTSSFDDDDGSIGINGFGMFYVFVVRANKAYLGRLGIIAMADDVFWPFQVHSSI